MKLYKLLVLGFFFMFSFFATSYIFALEHTAEGPSQSPPPSPVLVADLSLSEIRIVSQEDNVFEITFKIKNGKGLQAGVKYGVQLVSGDSKYIAHEYVYDESLTLYEDSEIERSIRYTAPSQISGEYYLVMKLENENSFPFSVVSLGKIKLSATEKGIHILNESCYLQVEGERNSPKYTLLQNIDINTSEFLRLTCSAENQTKEPVSLSPSFETRFFSSFGTIAPDEGGDVSPIVFNPNEKKNFSVLLPRGASPQFYSLKVKLANSELASNDVFIRYIISGTVGTVEKLSLDKDYYQKGEEGEMILLWSASFGNYFTRSKIENEGIPKVSAEINITSKNDKKCISPIKEMLTIDTTDPQTRIPFTLRTNCEDPRVSVVMLDEAGKVLDQKEFAFVTNPDQVKKTKGFSSIALLALVGIFIIGIFIHRKNKMQNQNDVIWPMIFLLVFLTAGVFAVRPASAVTYSQLLPSGCRVNSIVDVLPTTTFPANSSSTLTANAQIQLNANCGTGRDVTVTAQNNASSPVTLISGFFYPGTFPASPASTSFPVPNTDGSYTVSFVTGVDDPGASASQVGNIVYPGCNGPAQLYAYPPADRISFGAYLYWDSTLQSQYIPGDGKIGDESHEIRSMTGNVVGDTVGTPPDTC